MTTTPKPRTRISSGRPWETEAGYSRVVSVGQHAFVAGTVDADEQGRCRHPGDALAQARGCLDRIAGDLKRVGFSLEHVVRTRVYVTDASHAAGAIRAHGEAFEKVRPVTTLLVVAGLVSDEYLVEIEAEAMA